MIKPFPLRLSGLAAAALAIAALAAPASAAGVSLPNQFRTASTTDVVNTATRRCRQVCDKRVVGRQCVEATGYYNPQTNTGQAPTCRRWTMVMATVCRTECTTGGVRFYYK